MTYEEAMEIYHIKAEIKSLQTELQQHEESRRYYKTVVLTDLPKGRGQYKNPTDEYLIKEQRLKDMLRYSIDMLQDELLRFEEFLKSVKNAEMRTILRLRCINNMGWQEIGDEIGADRTTASRMFRKFFAQNDNAVY